MAAIDPAPPTARRTTTPDRVVRRTDETKPAFKTTEFIAYIAILAGVFIAGLLIKGGDTDEFKSPTVWLYAVILTFGYLLSRGIAKSGSRHRYDD
jgi:hypothetical protein